MRIFAHNFVDDKAKIRRVRAFSEHLCEAEAPTETTAENILAVLQGFLTQAAAKFAEKTCTIPCENRF